MRFLFLSLCLLLTVASTARAQEPAALSGFVRDATSEETLLLANVILLNTSFGAATNNSGYYTITSIPAGTYTVVARYIGYRPYIEEITLAAGENRRLDILLNPESLEIEEMIVTAERQEEEEARNLGVTQITTEAILELPAVFEPDVFRSLQLLPGVKAASDFSSGLYIRGGSPDQTLILLDRNTVYNPTHFFGFFSTFNPDAIKDVRLYKGGYPAPYGGRLGSVVDIYNKDGNRRAFAGTASVGLLASRAMVEGPFSRGSWMFAARRSTIDPLLAALRSADVEGIPNAFYFYDLNGKVNFDATENDLLSVAFYAGRDVLDISAFDDDLQLNIGVGNRTVSANWTHLFSQRLFSNFTLTASRYFSSPRGAFADTEFYQENNVYDVSAKGDFEFIPNGQHALKAGFWAGNFTMRITSGFDGTQTLGERIQSFNAAFYAQETFRPNALWEITAGVRANYFDQGNYLRVEPRLSAEYKPFQRVRFQAGYGRYYQFLTLITSELFSAFDIWLTTDDGVPPAYGDQFVAGVKTTLGERTSLDVEVYYRTMEDLFYYDPYLPDVAGLDYADLFMFGDGYAAGFETLFNFGTGRFGGFLGYTFGTTRRRFPNFKKDLEGNPLFFAPKYDRTHDLNLVTNLDLGRERSWRLTSVLTYATGQAYTFPRGRAVTQDYPFNSDGWSVFDSNYNNDRLAPYARLDIGATKRGGFFGFADYELQLQVINATARRNIWFYFWERQDDGTIEKNEVPQIPVPIPNIAFTLKF